MVPTQDELTNLSETGFLRRNKIKGAYKSVHDYLDVHFRLMREDFMIPLREGISTLKNINRKRKSKMPVNQVHIYHDAVVRYPVCLKHTIAHVVSFDTSRYKGCWESNKRLMLGSLLCFFSKDYSRSLLAIVAQRDAKALKKSGKITVQFITESLSQVSYNEKFVLIESSAFFESYRHVLGRLKVLSEDSFPFKEHIVYCDNIVKPPEYLLRDTTRKFDFQCISRTQEEDDAETRACPLDLQCWPSKETLGLDETQYAAMQTAITQRIAVIQGPPGTGKTYMGLKITNFLLENVVKHQEGFGPILLISYTNHALDQFLQGIAEFADVKIVRVGSQSKQEAVRRFMLSKIRREFIEDGSFTWNSRRDFKKKKDQIKDLYNQIMEKSARLRATRDHVLNLNMIKDNIDSKHFKEIAGSAKGNRQLHEKMKEWLEDTFTDDMLQEEMEATESISDDEDNENESIQNEDDEAMIENTRRKLECDDEKNDERETFLDKTITDLVGKDFIKWDQKNTNQKDDPHRKDVREKVLRSQLEEESCMTEEEEKQIVIRKLRPRQKWHLYRLWRSRYCLSLQSTLTDLKLKYEEVCNQVERMELDSDRQVFTAHHVVAMTTTAASRYGEVLSKLKPKIVIVEEAAEVLESHVIAALSDSCQHLILIGDHKQLRPKVNTLESARDNKLDRSLFERLIVNKFRYITLGLQHRMRPQIAKLLRQKVLYPELEDHESVMCYADVKGVASNLFFLDHKHHESQRENTSFSNDFEARFADRLCKHFLMQGYDPKDITILTLYSGQQSLLATQRTISGECSKGLRVAVVDNYQGEENEIIILSLVRSNEEQKIGFASNNNRICVALSRARVGLYVLGNLSQFKAANNLWAHIIKEAEKENQVGTALQLKCELHHDREGMTVGKLRDFDQHSPDGGCSKPCQSRLECGHICLKACHPTDNDHIEYKCIKMVDVGWKNCGHQVPCHKANVHENYCKENCEHILSCGHGCQAKCGQPHTINCTVMENKTSSFCRHEISIKCSSKNDTELLCRAPCREKLSCGHPCNGYCSNCCEGRIHFICRKKCNHTVICGHECRQHIRECSPCKKNCEMNCPHSKCSRLCDEKCIACKEKCTNRCGHRVCTNLCHEICNVPPCEKSCEKQFTCSRCKRKYNCLGLCGEKCINKCRSCDAASIADFYLNPNGKDNAQLGFLCLQTCGHIFDVSGLDKWMQDEICGAVGVKCCPKCKKTITLKSCKRYMNKVKETANKIQAVRDIIENEDEFDTRLDKLIDEVSKLHLRNLTKLTKTNYLLSLKKKVQKCSYASEILHFEGVLCLLRSLEKESSKIVESQAHGLQEQYMVGPTHILEGLLKAFDREMTSAILYQCKMETLRFGILRRILQLLCRFSSQSDHRRKCEILLTKCIGDYTCEFTQQEHEKMLSKIKELKQMSG